MFIESPTMSSKSLLPAAKFLRVIPEATFHQATELLTRYPESADEYLPFVEYLTDLRQPLLARIALEAATSFGAGLVGERACLGQVLWAEGRLQEAGDLMAAVFRGHPQDSLVNRTIGKMFLAMNRIDDAIPRLQSGLRGRENDWNQHMRLAWAFKQTGHYQQALEAAMRAMACAPERERERVHAFLGVIYWERGQRDLAFSHTLRAIQLNPQDENPNLNLANMFIETGLADAAVFLLRDYLQRYDNGPIRAQLSKLDKVYWESGKRLPYESPVSLGPKDRLVVFVVDEPRVRQCKLAAGLRSIGWKVVLLHRSKTDFPLEPYFDEARLYRTEYEALIFARDYDPVAFHVFSPWYDDTTTAFVRHKPGKVVYDYTDVFTEILTFDAEKGVEGQRFCVEQADGICCRDLRVRHAIRKLGWSKPKKAMVFMDYCWGSHLGRPLLPKRQDGFHVVSIGSFGVERNGQMDNGYLGIARMFADQGIHFHIYPVVRQMVYPDTFEVTFEDYLELQEKTGLVHLHRPVPMDEVIPEISQYHLGISIVQALTFQRPLEGYTDAHFRYCGSTRIFDYLDAGLPVLLNREFHLQYHALARYGLALVGNQSRLETLRQDLEKLYHDDVQARIIAMQARYSLNAQIPRLAAFYRDL